MNRYPFDATTLKTLDQFTYDVYSAMSVNMLKYNHDTSATIRLLSTLVNTSREVNEDLPYQISFNLRGLDFINIDRLNAFYWPQIKGFKADDDNTNCLFGYSKYTDKTYPLLRVEKQPDFIRHSLPVDSFFSGAVYPGTKQEITLYPYVTYKTNLEIKNSQVTLYPLRSFQQTNLIGRNPAKVTIFGVDIHGETVKEDVEFVASMNYVSDIEWKLITGFLLGEMATSATIIFYPYIAGDLVLSKNLVIDRQTFEPSVCLLSVNRSTKQLVYNMLRENYAEYPLGFDVLKTVPLQIKNGHDILSHYIDEPNKLLYTIHGLKEHVEAGTRPLPPVAYTNWVSWKDIPLSITIDPVSDADWVAENGGASYYIAATPAESNSSITWNFPPNTVLPEVIKFEYHAIDAAGSPIDFEMVGLSIHLSDGSTMVTAGGYGCGWEYHTGNTTGKKVSDITMSFDAIIDQREIRITPYFMLSQTGYSRNLLAFNGTSTQSTSGKLDNDPGDGTAVLVNTAQDWWAIYSGTPSSINAYGEASPPFDNPYRFYTHTDGTKYLRMRFYTSGAQTLNELTGLPYQDSLVYNTWNQIIIDGDADYFPPTAHVMLLDPDGNTKTDPLLMSLGVPVEFPETTVGAFDILFELPYYSDWLGGTAADYTVWDTPDQFSGLWNQLSIDANDNGPWINYVNFSYRYPTTEPAPAYDHYIEHTFACYPLIIPFTADNQLDKNKTEYQAVSVEYEEDCVNEEWNMWLFPTSKTNDVETCNITINGVPYIEGMLLDLIRYDIDTNRITIPFADIYHECATSALVEIETYGLERSYNAFRLDRTLLQSLYERNLDDYLRRFKSEPAVPNKWTLPTQSSTNVNYKGGDLIGYGEGSYGGMTETIPSKPFGWGGMMDINYMDYYEMYKLSSTANVAFNGQKIVNLFNTFYADENNKYIITSDTITHIKGADYYTANDKYCNGMGIYEKVEFSVESVSPTLLQLDGVVDITFTGVPTDETISSNSIAFSAPEYKLPVDPMSWHDHTSDQFWSLPDTMVNENWSWNPDTLEWDLYGINDSEGGLDCFLIPIHNWPINFRPVKIRITFYYTNVDDIGTTQLPSNAYMEYKDATSVDLAYAYSFDDEYWCDPTDDINMLIFGQFDSGNWVQDLHVQKIEFYY